MVFMTPEILPDEMVVRRVEVFKLSESLEGNGSFPNRMIVTGQTRLRTAIRENVESISWVFPDGIDEDLRRKTTW